MNQEQRIEYFMSEIARLSNQVVALQDERDALAAQVEELRKAIEPVNDMANRLPEWSKEDRCHSDELEKALEMTPQQHLAEIRAQAGRDGYLQGHLDAAGDDVGEWSRKHSEYHAKQYADSIRRGEVK